MAKKVRSARGVLLDFDLFKIKQQIASGPKTVDVKAREDFVDKKLNRRLKRTIKKLEKKEVVANPKATDNKTK